MEANIEKVFSMRIKTTIEALEKNNMKAMYVPTSKEALALMQTLLVPGETIAVGGSVTLVQTGILDLIRSGKYNFIDRYESGISREEVKLRLRAGLTSDTFVMSSNAITENGCLYNVDGTGNRVAALIYGPSRVIVVAGYNKIVHSVADAVRRVKEIATPANCIRLDLDTYCSKHGHCLRDVCDSNDLMSITPETCKTCICSHSLVSGSQRLAGRITVIIVGEELGY